VPWFFFDEDNESMGRMVTLQELKMVVVEMPKDKSPGPDGWTQELFSHFFDMMGWDLLYVVEESIILGFVNGALNSTFVALIPKQSKPL